MGIRQLDPKALTPECFTITEFCRTHGLSRSAYYRLRDEGRGPEEFRFNDNMPKAKVLITKEAAARWRAGREAESKQEGVRR